MQRGASVPIWSSSIWDCPTATDWMWRERYARRRTCADHPDGARPLAAVQAQLEGVIDGVYPADREHLEPLLDQTRVLSRLIEDLRVLSLAESGALTLHRETTDLGQLVEDTAAAFRAQAASAGVALAVDAATQLREWRSTASASKRSSLTCSRTHYATRRAAGASTSPSHKRRRRSAGGDPRHGCWYRSRRARARVRPFLEVGRFARQRIGTRDTAGVSCRLTVGRSR